MALKHGKQLGLERCPQCSVAKPHLRLCYQIETTNHAGNFVRHWGMYLCQSCGGVTLAVAHGNKDQPIQQIWPELKAVSEAVPERAREYLAQAIASIHSPAGAVMLAASSVDAMLKAKGLTEGTLNSRIKSASEQQLITNEMAEWAHEIRLDANDQRHADEIAPLPSEADASKAIEFSSALAQFLFVLPARVERGREQPSE